MSLLDEVRKLEQQVMKRLRELEPLTREYDQLCKLAERLGLKYTPRSEEDEGEAKAPTATSARGRKRAPKRAAHGAAKPQAARSPARKRAAKAAAKPRAARATGARRPAVPPGQRQDDVLRLVGEQPGITVREIGERLGVDATGLYRVVKRLSDDGRVRKDGTRLHPVEPPATRGADGTSDGTPAAAADSESPAATAPKSPATDTRSAGQS